MSPRPVARATIQVYITYIRGMKEKLAITVKQNMKCDVVHVRHIFWGEVLFSRGLVMMGVHTARGRLYMTAG